jgi:hypothetical protein
MKFTKYNNPNKRKTHKKMSRTDADILAAKNMTDDRRNGIELPLSYYDEQSDRYSGSPSRHIYN